MSQGRRKRRSKAPTFFLDRNLGHTEVANRLRGEGVRVQIHDNHFSHDTPDDVWLPSVGKRGWVILTQDEHILRRLPELVALLQANTFAFVLKAKDLTGKQIGESLVKAVPKMTRLIDSREPPLVGRITKSGIVDEIEGYNDIIEKILKLMN